MASFSCRSGESAARVGPRSLCKRDEGINIEWLDKQLRGERRSEMSRDVIGGTGPNMSHPQVWEPG